MASSHAGADEHDASPIDSSAPFKGVIVCCTSIPPEQRTEIAQSVVELGGVHKYDLTPDVTHLVVGDYDTPKYRHVARERMDIKPMDAAWIEAVTDLWKNDDELDFAALEKEYQLRPLERCGADAPQPGQPAVRDSLLICLTGFGDQREDIADKITASGGRYTGDLTRKCSHLIVNKPEGKKWAAAKSWGLHAVTLDWLHLSVERGMILEETRFDPMLPPEEHGVGAWIKTDPRPGLGKRSRSTTSHGGEDGPRKLRKTASMKLSSQRNHIWGDILGRSTSREYSFAEHEPAAEEAPPQPPVDQGIFSGCIFFTHGFTKERSTILEQTIATLDGHIASSLDDTAAAPAYRFRFLIVPQASQPNTHPHLASADVHIVTEFYIEKCLHNKRFFGPDEHVLGRPFPAFPVPGFASLRISSAAFTGIELSQVARSVVQLGATFDEFFNKETSLVVCKSLAAMRKEKLRLAVDWDVPVVSADWLWECISTGYNVPIDDFVFPELSSSRKPDPSIERKSTKPAHLTQPTQKYRHDTSQPGPKPPAGARVDPTAFDRESPEKQQQQQPRPVKMAPQQESTISADFNTARTHQVDSFARDSEPLSERSSASLNKSPSPTKSAAVLRTRSNPVKIAAVPEPAAVTQRASAPPPDTVPDPSTSQVRRADEEKSQAKAAERQIISSKLSTLLASAASASPDTPTEEAGPRPRRRHLMGRAVSNASNTSSAAKMADVQDEPDEPEGPPGTQLQYCDPEAAAFKKAAIDRMMGGAGEIKPTQGVAVPTGRSLRKR